MDDIVSEILTSLTPRPLAQHHRGARLLVEESSMIMPHVMDILFLTASSRAAATRAGPANKQLIFIRDLRQLGDVQLGTGFCRDA